MQSRKKAVAVFAAVNALGLGASIARAADYTWANFAGGTYIWEVDANWTSGGPGTPAYPNQPGDSANVSGTITGSALNINVSGAGTLAASLATLTLGDTGAVPFATTVGSAVGGKLIFDPVSVIHSLGTAGAVNTLSGSIQLNNNLTISTLSTNGLVFSGTLQANGANRNFTNSIPAANGVLLNTGTTLLWDATDPTISRNVTFTGNGTTIHSGRFINGDGTLTGSTGDVTFTGGTHRLLVAQPNLTDRVATGGIVIIEHDQVFGTATLAPGGQLRSNNDARTISNYILHGGGWSVSGDNSLTTTGGIEQTNNSVITNNIVAGKSWTITGAGNPLGVAAYLFEYDAGDHVAANPPQRYWTIDGPGNTIVNGKLLPSPADIATVGTWPAAYHIRKRGLGVMNLNATADSKWFRMQLEGGVLAFGPGNTFGQATSIELVRGGGVWKAEGSSSPEYTTMINLIAANSTGALALPATEAATNFNFSAGDLAGRPAVAIGAFGDLTYTGVVTPGTAGYNWGGGNGTLTLNGNNRMTGANNVRYANGTKVVVTGTQSYTGRTQLDTSLASILEVSSIPNGGVASPLGQSSSDAANLFFTGGTLRYVGAGDSTDRLFTLGATPAATTLGFLNGPGGNGAGIDASGTGVLNFTNTGTVVVDDSVVNTARTLTLSGTGTGILSANIVNGGNAVSVTKSGTGKWTLGGNLLYTGTTSVTGGTLLVNKKLANGTISVTGGRLEVLAKATPNDPTATAVVPQLTIGAAGVVDLSNHSLVRNYTALGTLLQDLRGHLFAGRLISTSATATRRLGYGDNAVLGKTTFAGVSPSANSLLIKYTYAGDADLDGDADGVDIGTWATSFSGELSGGAGATLVWGQGDWDYDGDVDGVDAGLWATAFTGELSGGGLGSVVVETTNPQATQILQGLGVTVVPEPAAIGLLGLGLVGGVARRSRRRPLA